MLRAPRRLVRDRRVADTNNVDRVGFRVLSDPGEPWSDRLQRAVPLLRTRLVAENFNGDNAAAWLYYLAVSLPALALLVLAGRAVRVGPPHERFVREFHVSDSNRGLVRTILRDYREKRRAIEGQTASVARDKLERVGREADAKLRGILPPPERQRYDQWLRPAEVDTPEGAK